MIQFGIFFAILNLKLDFEQRLIYIALRAGTRTKDQGNTKNFRTQINTDVTDFKNIKQICVIHENRVPLNGGFPLSFNLYPATSSLVTQAAELCAVAILR